jgi:glycosyltransferase involved in cell wall biosynthesis
MIILIPAYEPDDQLLRLIRSIAAAAPQLTLVVVDDGSGPDYQPVFDGAARLGCTVIGFARNRGKGHALKAGFGYIADHFPGQDVVCADSDGQHRVEDILRVAERLPDTSDAMVLGTRSFSGNVPARSRLGNAATRWLFRLATGETIPDTQTGLRGYPAAMLTWLRDVPGERYEYELNLLLEAKQDGYLIRTVDIATVYLDHNSGSHFRPVTDSVRIYAPLLKFLASSLTAFILDTAAFLVLIGLTGSVLFAVVGARGISSAVNFLINRHLVFRHGKERRAGRTGIRYFALVLTLLAANLALMSALDQIAVAALPAKLLAEAALLAVSYSVQQRFLFSRQQPPADQTTGPATGRAAGQAGRTTGPASATHIPAMVPAQFPHSLGGNRRDQSTH